jgi:Rad3-related DNA helicase
MLFLPHAYLFNKKILNKLGIKLDNKIIVLDEAHHCEEITEDQNSISIDFNDVLVAKKYLVGHYCYDYRNYTEFIDDLINKVDKDKPILGEEIKKLL